LWYYKIKYYINVGEFMKHIKYISVLVVVLATFAIIIYYAADLLENFTTPDVKLIFSFFFAVTVFLASSIFGLLDSKKEEKNTAEMRKQYDVIYSDIKSSVISENSTSEKNTDILELMLANMREINDYYILSKTQAQKSFSLAVVMCIIGIVLMGVSIFAAFFQSSNVISAIIPAVGAAIVEVIAGTSLIVYKNSLSQLNRYFNSLHSNERFLSIVNIVSKASPEKQDDMYFEIIKSQIGLVSTDLIENTNEEDKTK